ncbi:MAG: DUF1574 family protein [Acidobacteriota bacterium]|nr:DUF1574 family protein [Acidobacteriota bacterium]
MQYVSVEAPAIAAEGPASQAAAWRRFVRRFLGLLFALLAAIGLLNYLVNPEGIYSAHLLPPVTWNTRAAKAELLAAAALSSQTNPQTRPEALILGSSRLMTIAPAEVERVTGLRTFNAAVNAAYSEDFYVLLRYAVERAGVRPQLVLIGLDAEAFHDHEPENEYLMQPNALGGYLQKGEARGAAWRRFTNLFTVYQTKLSFLSLYDRMGGKKVNAVEFAADGSIKEDPWLRQRAAGNYDLQAKIEGTAAEYIPRYQSYTGVARDRLDYFAATLRYAREQGARVIVFATPVHPELERALAPFGYPQRKREAYAAAQQVAQRESAEFVDLSRPESFGGAAEHFYDGVHVDAYNAERLVVFLAKVPLANQTGPSTHAVQ